MFLINIVGGFCAPLVCPLEAWAQYGAPPRGVPRWFLGYRHSRWGTVKQLTCHMFLINIVEGFCAPLVCPLDAWAQYGAPPRGAPPTGVPRWFSGYRPSRWGTVKQLTCHMFLINIVEGFCAPLVCPLEAWAQYGAPPTGVPRWFSGCRPSRWGTVKQLTCHMFLINIVEGFCAPLVCPLEAWAQYGAPPRGVPRWFSGYRPSPWGTVKQLTCHMFLINIVEGFCAPLLCPLEAWAQYGAPPRGGCRDGSRAVGPPAGGQ